MATTLPRWIVPVMVGVLLLALTATSLVLWLVKGESSGSGSVDATDEIALACGIDKEIGAIEPGQKAPPRTDKGADVVDDLGLELMLIYTAGLHDEQYAAAGKRAEKTYQRTILYFNLDAFSKDRSTVTAPCSHVSATSVPSDPSERLGAYADFGCRLGATVADAHPRVKKLSVDDAVVGDMEVLDLIGQPLVRSNESDTRGKAFIGVSQALTALDQDRLDEALSAVTKACG